MTKKELYEKFIFAIRDNDLETVKECVKRGVDVNRCFDINGSNPLYLCLMKNRDARMFRYLVANGADVTKRIGGEDVKNWLKPSLLSFAVDLADVPIEIVKTILENGGDRDINYAPKGQSSPLEEALRKKDVEMLKLFSKYCDFRISPKLIDREIKDNRKVIKNTKTI